MDQHGLPRYHNFLLVRLIYHSKVNLVGPLYAEKFVESGCLYVFIIEFLAYLLPMENHLINQYNQTPRSILFNALQCPLLHNGMEIIALRTNNYPQLEVETNWPQHFTEATANWQGRLKKSLIRETKHLSIDADSSTDTKKNQKSE